ncbi:MAG: glucosamine-6-phosphate deaminase [Propionibacterium sp.]|nr:glucosamine-6-phosphate deaminase [Propionibacterium sp.]
MKVAILPDSTAIGTIAADQFEDLLRRTTEAVVGLATGSSPLPLYDELVDRTAAGRLSFAHARAFTLDEYVGLPEGHPQSYRSVIHRDLVDRVDLPQHAVASPDGNAEDLQGEAARYDASIREAGGIDLQLLGIGTDGHLAFNEPGGSLASRTHVGVLTGRTRQDNARFFGDDLDAVPTRCLTQGLGTIMEARKLVLIATGASKATAVREMVEGAVSALWPATLLQFHPDVLVLLDEDAASGLALSDYYREVWRTEAELF